MARSKRSKRGRRSDNSEQVITIRGHQNYVSVVNGTSGTQLFTSTNVAVISPDSMGTQIADIANHWNQYRFTKLWFEYCPADYNLFAASGDSHSSAVSNLFAFGYEEDATLTFTITYDNINALQHSKSMPNVGFRNSGDNILKVNKLKDVWRWTKDDTSTDADARQTVQGLLYGEARTSISSSLDWGKIKVHYTIQFKDMCPTQGVTLAGLMNEARLGRCLMLRKILLFCKHAAAYAEVKGDVTKLDTTQYTNEECAILGIHRSLTPEIVGPSQDFISLLRQLEETEQEYEVLQSRQPVKLAFPPSTMEKAGVIPGGYLAKTR